MKCIFNIFDGSYTVFSPRFSREGGKIFEYYKKEQVSKILFGAKLNHSKGKPRHSKGALKDTLEEVSRSLRASRSFPGISSPLMYAYNRLLCGLCREKGREREREILKDLHNLIDDEITTVLLPARNNAKIGKYRET